MRGVRVVPISLALALGCGPVVDDDGGGDGSFFWDEADEGGGLSAGSAASGATPGAGEGGEPACDLGDVLEEVLGGTNYICGLTPYGDGDESFHGSHNCVMNFLGTEFLLRWTMPGEPQEAAFAGRTVDGEYELTYWELNGGVVTQYGCEDIVETPGCDVAAGSMCLTCTGSSSQGVVCPPE